GSSRPPGSAICPAWLRSVAARTVSSRCSSPASSMSGTSTAARLNPGMSSSRDRERPSARWTSLTLTVVPAADRMRHMLAPASNRLGRRPVVHAIPDGVRLRELAPRLRRGRPDEAPHPAGRPRIASVAEERVRFAVRAPPQRRDVLSRHAGLGEAVEYGGVHVEEAPVVPRGAALHLGRRSVGRADVVREAGVRERLSVLPFYLVAAATDPLSYRDAQVRWLRAVHVTECPHDLGR